MTEFLLLGEVPGTSIIISFTEWMILLGILLAAVSIYLLVSRRRKLIQEVRSLRLIRQNLETRRQTAQ